MRMRHLGWGLGLGFACLLSGLLGACGSDNVPSNTAPAPTGEPPTFPGDSTDGGNVELLDVQPSELQTITVPFGQQSPTVTFTATSNGAPVSVGWDVDRGDVGSVAGGPATTTTFTPTGRAGGLVEIVARVGDRSVKRQVLVKITGEQDGPTAAQSGQVANDPASLTAGGGIGGVGGEGLGGPVTDGPTKAALGAPTSNGSSEKLSLLYPYSDTVFPRGLLAPLLMWDWTLGDADAVRITLETTSGSFSWTGTFSRPAILTTTGGKFVRHPIPQDIWKAATDTAGGLAPDGSRDRLKVSITVARNGVAYGPIAQTYTIAPARLSGIVYYNSYGTRYAENLGGAVGGNGRFGGATLSIRVGETAPSLVAGGNGGTEQCRVCHSVAASGASLVTVRSDNDRSVAYELAPTGATERAMTVNAHFPAGAPDGATALTSDGKIVDLPNAATAQPTTGLQATHLGTPAFAPDGKLVALNPFASASIVNPKQKLFVAPFDAATRTFGAHTLVADNTGAASANRPGWPAFLPDSKSLVFHQQVAEGVGEADLYDLRTRRGAQAYIAWTNTTDSTKVTALDRLNGKGYLPALSSASVMTCTADGHQVGGIDPLHANDHQYNYEPTVNPAPSGGYAWVVFTSRRLYGNLATIPPFCSDPRGVNLVTNITTKKLWVAAIDLSAKPGADASHPAFYLPAQELLAGNTRGFWVLDPCKQENASCESGDECCGGFCKPNASGALVCTNKAPACADIGDKCTTSADCCQSGVQCIGGFCRGSGPK